jgi:molecular chaperone DnaK
LDVADLSRVLLVGGSTRIPVVWELVADYTGLEPDAEINPDEAVALGAAVQAAIIAGQPVDSILVDVTPYSLGIETAIFIGGHFIPDQYSVLIRRNTTVPVTKEEIYHTLHPDQENIDIKVYQGEHPVASANTLLGNFLISGLKAAAPDELASVTVRFDFDVNGILHVRATDRHTGKQASTSVQATQARLSPGEIDKAREQLPAPVSPALLPSGPELDEETQALLDRAQVLLDGESLSDEDATGLRDLIEGIHLAQLSGDPDQLDELSEELLDMLFDLE